MGKKLFILFFDFPKIEKLLSRAFFNRNSIIPCHKQRTKQKQALQYKNFWFWLKIGDVAQSILNNFDRFWLNQLVVKNDIRIG
jgi:hypothetical protein